MSVRLVLLLIGCTLLLGGCGEDAQEVINALTGGDEEQSGGLTPAEANSYGYVCSDLAAEANSYGVPTQLPQYYAAACLQNLIAKESPSAIVDEAARRGISSSLADAQQYVAGYANSCRQNLDYARSLSSSATAVSAPSGYYVAINKILSIINLQQPVVSGTSIGSVWLDCNVAY